MKKISDNLTLGFCRLGIAGLASRAPGTWGTFLACILAPFIYLPLDFFDRSIFLLLLFFLGAYCAGNAEKILGKKDPGEVVIDELVGVWFAMLPFAYNIWLIIIAFILFRFFDILKPWPVKASEMWLPNGYGIMIDDVMAGAYAMICLYIIKFTGIFYFIL